VYFWPEGKSSRSRKEHRQ